MNSAYRWVYDAACAARRCDGARRCSLARHRRGMVSVGIALSRVADAAGARQRRLPKLVEPPELRPFLAEVAAVRRRVRAVDIPVLTSPATTRRAKPARCTTSRSTMSTRRAPERQSRVVDRPVRRAAASSASARRRVASSCSIPWRNIDPNDARYAWFDHVLREAERPALLSANVNYQLAGANEWRHEPSLAALESKPLRLLPRGLAGRRSFIALAAEKGRGADVVDRHRRPARPRRRRLAPSHELVRQRRSSRATGALFVTEPFDEPVDARGPAARRARLHDQQVRRRLASDALRAALPNGEYVKLFEPAYTFRASYSARPRASTPAAGGRTAAAPVSEREDGRPSAATRQPVGADARRQQARRTSRSITAAGNDVERRVDRGRGRTAANSLA